MVIINSRSLAQTAPQLGKASVSEVVNAMTLQEKAQLVIGMGWSPKHMKVPGAAGQTHAVPRLGIPSIVLADGPAGVRIKPIRDEDSSQTFYATAFPVARMLASSWDTALVQEVGQAYGNEAHEYGVDIALAPALNIHRNPRGGRNFEYYSEDPLIAGKMAAAMVRGIQSEGVGTSIKHFVANNQESNRTRVSTIASERALREIYLKGFKIAVQDAHPWTVMSSYNKLNGTYTAQRHDLLTTILRDEWGFDGLVMTDWGGGDNPVEQMKAGNDLIMPGSEEEANKIAHAVESGSLDKEVLDKNVSRILSITLKTPTFKNYNYSNNPDLKAHAQTARKAADESIILLENKDHTLPLKKENEIVAFGNTSYDIIIGGRGSGEVNQAYSVQLMEGIADAGYKADKYMERDYKQYIKKTKAQNSDHNEAIAEMPISAEKAREEAENNDVAIITIGRNSGEGADRSESDFYLNENEKTLIKNVSDAFHDEDKKVIVILNVAGVIDIESWKDQADAIVLAWQPGQESGHAIADVLTGKVNPSGHLATTIPVDYSDVPTSDYFPGTPDDKPTEVIYKEGIYIGYRYFDSFDVQPAYPFGYGLSYTQFIFDDTRLGSTDGKNMLTTTITNRGDMAGKEVVQLYISEPGENQPAQKLKAFAKTHLLEPGESQKISFQITPKELASFNPERSAWEVKPGKYTLKIGASSRDIRATETLEIEKEATIEKVHDVLHPAEPVKEMQQ